LVWPGKRLKNLQPTEKIGVEVWPNVFMTRDDLSLTKRVVTTSGDVEYGDVSTTDACLPLQLALAAVRPTVRATGRPKNGRT